MKPIAFSFLLFTAMLMVWGCKKDTITTSPDAQILPSADTLYFDTVFTSKGSITKQLRLVNPNDQALQLSNIRLAGASASAYQINVNGTAGTAFTNVKVNAGDSIYIFVKVTIDPNNSLSPFLVRDSILVDVNGKTKNIQLQAYGQNARYINGGRITGNVTWNNTLPYVITAPFTVDTTATLTILEGTRIYCNATAPIFVNGTIRATGDKYDSTRIVFRGDRLDAPYNELPGAWPGIVFNNVSRNNLLQYVNILNAYQALIVGGGAGQSPAKLTLNNCIIDNAYDIGLFAFNTSIEAVNCRFTQIGNEGTPGTGGSNVIIAGGGNINFNHCTLATFANYYQNHKMPVCFITNSTGSGTAALNMNMRNCIIWGQSGFTEDEIVTNRVSGAAFNVSFSNVLYKAKNDPAGITFAESIRNQDPLFDSINTSLRLYNFRLRETSPAVNAGAASGAANDLDGNPRPVGNKPDMGAYERQ